MVELRTPLSGSCPEQDSEAQTNYIAPVPAAPEPKALFLTWRTYGTWLPGDERGWVERNRNGYGEATNKPDARLEGAAASRMRSRRVELTEAPREVVAESIRATCEVRDWVVMALNVRTNHVHLVVGADESSDRVLNSLKAHATRSLRKSSLLEEAQDVWARGGSKRVLWNDESLAATINYTVNRQ